ncbi:MAG TPA: fumarylacetoacetate hydrolase family protein, partial [Cellvibrionaceae bacterium]|nr:fumarylacetoacetate hydrolase family protein [Cellvibrionaceae bacterium]
MWLVTDLAGNECLPWLPRRIFCIGRNYADHAREMGHNPDLEPPFFFTKPLTSLCPASGNWQLPDFSRQVEHEVELVIGLRVPPEQGRNISAEGAQSWIAAAGLGIDMTCRDLQREAKQAGRPWDIAKGFDAAAPLTPLVQLDAAGLNTLGAMQLKVNGELRQTGHWQEMLWPPGELIAHIARYFALQTGDLIFTGTPAGVG